MNVCVVEHQHKAQPYINALLNARHHIKRRTVNAECLLIDHEWSGLFAGYRYTWRPQIIEAEKMGIPVFIYPHSVRPNIPFDLTDDFYPRTSALFTIAKGHKEILNRLDYPCPVEVTGWAYTEIHPFRQQEPQDKIRVLFAPIHPVGNGYLPDVDRELNTKCFQLLLGLLDDISLTVRHIQSLEKNGIWFDERVNYTTGHLDGSTREMERANVIIGAFTYAYMSVALGHPLIMIGEGVLPHNSPRKDGKMLWARNWDKYKDYLRFPFNVEDCHNSNDLLRMMKESLYENPLVENWKEHFIGDPFDGKKFVKTLESYLC